MNDVFHYVLWGNTVLQYSFVLAGIIITWIILKLIKKRLLVLLKKVTAKSTTNVDDIAVEMAERFIIPYLYLLINYTIVKTLAFTPQAERILSAAFLVVTVYYAVRLVNFFVQKSVVGYMHRKGEPAERIRQVSGMLVIVKAITWSAGIIMLLDNLGYNVTTVIAGLGVGGIAIALAAQNILSDLFSYFVIFFDKPFAVGDFIIVNGNSGVVERIGIKTSHIRSLDGQQLVMPNADMVKSVIQNFKRLERKRVVFSISVIYQTSADKLKRIPAIIKDIITQKDKATFDRTHLVSLGNSSINYEVVYYIESPDYLLFMDTQQSICLQIFEQFEKAKIEFAYPTQTLFVNNKTIEPELNLRNKPMFESSMKES